MAFVGVNHPEHGPGFDVWGWAAACRPTPCSASGSVRGCHSTRCPMWEAITSAFRDYGYRRPAVKARLKFLIKDWGPQKFRESSKPNT